MRLFSAILPFSAVYCSHEHVPAQPARPAQPVKPIMLNQNTNDVANHIDVIVTPLQQRVLEAKGKGHVPERFVKPSGDLENEVLHKELVDKFGDDYEAKLGTRPDKGFSGYSLIDGVQGGEWRVLRDVKGMWHVPVQFGAGQSWIDKKIDVGFWGSEKDTLMTGKSFIAKVQEEWKRATCLSVDFFDDESTLNTFLTNLDSNPDYSTAGNLGFIHPDFVPTATRTNMNRINVINGEGCYSYVGRVAKTQELSLIDSWCSGSVNSALHEFMHAMGFHHEQSRYDRDSMIFVDTRVCNNYDFSFWLRLKQSKSEWSQMYHALGKIHDMTSIMHYESWVCKAPNTANTIDGNLVSPDGGKWKEYGFTTKDGQILPTARDEKNRFRISDLVQINEAYNCNDPTNDNLFHTYLLYCDDDITAMYPVGWKCDGNPDCADGSDETRCNIVTKTGTGGTLVSNIGSLASGTWVNLAALKDYTQGIRTDTYAADVVGYPCTKFAYKIVDHGASIKCECKDWAGHDTTFGSDVDLSLTTSNCDTVNPDLCSLTANIARCALVSGGECVLDIDQEDGFTCCDPPANSKTEYENREGVCVEVNRCEDNTHFCMSDGYGGLCTWTTNVGYKCGCRPGYAGTGCSYRAFTEGEGECSVSWDIGIGSQHGGTANFPYHATCHATDACIQGLDDCVLTATCLSKDENFGIGAHGTYSCSCPAGITGDGMTTGTGCGGDMCQQSTDDCPKTDSDSADIVTCNPTGYDTWTCICPDTHYDANLGVAPLTCTALVNECTELTDDCATYAGSQCVDLEEGFTCKCAMPHGLDSSSDGYASGGNFGWGQYETGSYETADLACEDVNECTHFLDVATSSLTAPDYPCKSANAVCSNIDLTGIDDITACRDFTGKVCPMDIGGFWGSCPMNLACETFTCACSEQYTDEPTIVTVDGETFTITGQNCNKPVDYNNCDSVLDATGTVNNANCVAPFCNHDCADEKPNSVCQDTGPILHRPTFDVPYEKGYYCGCISGQYGNPCEAPAHNVCPGNSTLGDAPGIYHSESFPAVVEDFMCSCNIGFYDLNTVIDDKNPNCVSDICTATSCHSTQVCKQTTAVIHTCTCADGYVTATTSNPMAQPEGPDDDGVDDGDTVPCIDIDECALGTHACASGTTCTNLPGTFVCVAIVGPTKDCKCNADEVFGSITRPNGGTLRGECTTKAFGKSNEPWGVYCDDNGNKVQDADEPSISLSMNKKCKKIASGSNSITCGESGDGGGDGGGTDPPACSCTTKPKDCPTCDGVCTGESGKKVIMQFTCPAGSDNAGNSKNMIQKCSKIAKKSLGLSCNAGDGDNSGGGGTCKNGQTLPAGCKNCKKFKKGKC